jgi:hypothetical protein
MGSARVIRQQSRIGKHGPEKVDSERTLDPSRHRSTHQARSFWAVVVPRHPSARLSWTTVGSERPARSSGVLEIRSARSAADEPRWRCGRELSSAGDKRGLIQGWCMCAMLGRWLAGAIGNDRVRPWTTWLLFETHRRTGVHVISWV